MMDTLAVKYDFTWTVEADPNNDWGLYPSSGDFNDFFNENATFHGVMGNVINS